MKRWIFAIILLVLPVHTAHATLSCTVAASCADTVLFKISSTDNGHAGTSGASSYTQLVCCSGVTGLGNSCSGTYDVVLQLSGTDNAHAEQNTQANYATDVCLSSGGDTVTIAYQSTNCTGYDTTVASMSATTNAHVGNSSAYATKICASISSASSSLSFSISDNTIGFGALSASSARYATGDTTGTGSETEAHTLAASTNATNGYTITVQGATLTSGSYTIAAIGGTNANSSAGTEQFGLRASDTGTGSVSSPYAAAGFAYAATAGTASTLGTGLGDSSSTTFSLRYLANITTATEPGSYVATLTYVATANF